MIIDQVTMDRVSGVWQVRDSRKGWVGVPFHQKLPESVRKRRGLFNPPAQASIFLGAIDCVANNDGLQLFIEIGGGILFNFNRRVDLFDISGFIVIIVEVVVQELVNFTGFVLNVIKNGR